MLYIGVDLGTSAVKLLLVDGNLQVKKTVSRTYPLLFPHPGWSEQNPEDWWKACLDGLAELLEDIDKSSIAGIGVAGQMHGLVILDSEDRVIRPAILWNDGRTAAEVDYLNNRIGEKQLSAWTANIAFAGFTAPKILWLQNNEPENFRRIHKIMLPKDYINFMLTGIHSCDYSDASGMLLLDVKNKCWSEEMLSVCHLSLAQMPKLYESYSPVGTISPELSSRLGLSKETIVAAGAGDNAAAALGTGIAGTGACNISLGTSGTIFTATEAFCVEENHALHTFVHADGHYHLLGCMLSAASCNKWFCEEILCTKRFEEEQLRIEENMLGNNQVFFLPYLMGERSPINDADARGVFVGMSLNTSRSDMLLAVLEGVAFAIRDSFILAEKLMGTAIHSSKLCGGGAKSRLWGRILANVLNARLELPQVEEGPGFGAAMLAMTACGEYKNINLCLEHLSPAVTVIEPEMDLVEKYEQQYQKFRYIYPAMKGLFKALR